MKKKNYLFASPGIRNMGVLVFLLLIGVLVSCSAISPKRPEIKAIRYYNLGVELLKQEQWVDALTHFNLVIQLDNTVWEAYANKGLILVKKEKYKEAIDAFKQGLWVSPENTKLLYNIGICYYRLGNVEIALNYMEKVYKLDRSHQYAKNNFLGYQFEMEQEKDSSDEHVFSAGMQTLSWPDDQAFMLSVLQNPNVYVGMYAQQPSDADPSNLTAQLQSFITHPLISQVSNENITQMNPGEDPSETIVPWLEDVPSGSIGLIIEVVKEDQVSSLDDALLEQLQNTTVDKEISLKWMVFGGQPKEASESQEPIPSTDLSTTSISSHAIKLIYNVFEKQENQKHEPFTISYLWTIGLGSASCISLGMGTWAMLSAFSLKEEAESSFLTYQNIPQGTSQTEFDSMFKESQDLLSAANSRYTLGWVLLGSGIGLTAVTVGSLFFMENFKLHLKMDRNEAEVLLSLRF